MGRISGGYTSGILDIIVVPCNDGTKINGKEIKQWEGERKLSFDRQRRAPGQLKLFS